MHIHPTEIEEPLSAHLAALRTSVARCLIVFFLFFLACLAAHRPLYSIITYPLKNLSSQQNRFVETATVKKVHNRSNTPQTIQLENGSIHLLPGEEKTIYIPEKTQLAILSPIDGMTTTLTLSFWAALTLSAPFWMSFAFQFVQPAIYPVNRWQAPFFLLIFLFSLALGLFFGFTFFIPFANNTLYAFNTHIGQNTWTVSNYISYTTQLLAGSAIACQAAGFLLALVLTGKIRYQTMKGYSRLVIVGIFIFSAILTPPDILSQLFMALPLVGLWMGALFLAYAKSKPGL